MVQEKGMNRLRLLGLVGDGDNVLQSVVDRQGILLGKLINEVGLGNILYGIESPDTDVATHVASSSAHHVKYSDANALAAIAGAGLYTLIDGSVAFTGVVAGIFPTEHAHLATKEYVDSAIHFIEDYFFNNTASSYSGIYFKMLDTPTGEAESTFQSGSLGEGDDQALFNFATDAGAPGVTTLEAGVYTGHIHARVTLSNKRPVKIHFKVYFRDNGSETLVATSEETGFLTNSATEYNIHAVLVADVTIATTDRLIIKWFANVDSTPSSNVIVELFAEGTNASRFQVPVTTDVLNQVFLRQDGTKELTGNLSVASGVTIDGVDISARDHAKYLNSEAIAAVEGEATLLLAGNVGIAKSFSLSGDISPAQITADTHNYDPAGLSDASRIRVFTDASRNLTGIVPKSPDDGRILIVCNIGSNDLVLVAQSASSTDVNRFGMSGSITLVDGDAVTLQYDTTSNRWRVIGLSPGSAPTYASIAETNTGTEAAKSVTPDGLAGSNYGERTIDILVSDPNGDAITTGDSKAKVQIPSTVNGWNLIEVESSLSTVSSSGIPTVQIRRSRRASATSRTNADMLSTKLTIDASEFDSEDAVAAAVINGSNDDVNTGDHIYIDIDVAGTGAKGLSVRMTFRLP